MSNYDEVLKNYRELGLEFTFGARSKANLNKTIDDVKRDIVKRLENSKNGISKSVKTRCYKVLVDEVQVGIRYANSYLVLPSGENALIVSTDQQSIKLAHEMLIDFVNNGLMDEIIIEAVKRQKDKRAAKLDKAA